MFLKSDAYPASLKIDYPKKLSRLTTFFRIFLVIPILFILLLISGNISSGIGDNSVEKYEDDTKVTNIERTENGKTIHETITETMTVKDGKKMTVTESVVDGGEPTFIVASEDLPDVNVNAKFASEGLGILGGLFLATVLMLLFKQRYPRWWFDFNLELNRFSTRVGAYILLLTDQYPSTAEEQTVHLDLKYPDAKKDLNRWLPLIKWLLALPHYIILLFLMIGVFFAVIIAWFAILFTSRYPKGLFDFVVGVMRWGWRVSAYAFLLTTDRYPQFSLK